MSEPIGGIVKNGVIVPEQQLPEGARVSIAPDVPALLKERNREKQFSDLLALIGRCFPQALSLDVYLEEDCTEPTWLRVVIDVYFATDVTDTQGFLRLWREFDQQYVDLIPIDYPPLFLVMRRYGVNK